MFTWFQVFCQWQNTWNRVKTWKIFSCSWTSSHMLALPCLIPASCLLTPSQVSNVRMRRRWAAKRMLSVSRLSGCSEGTKLVSHPSSSSNILEMFTINCFCSPTATSTIMKNYNERCCVGAKFNHFCWLGHMYVTLEVIIRVTKLVFTDLVKSLQLTWW